MRAKWNPIVVETDMTCAEVGADGRLYEVPKITVGAEDVAMMRQGYKCVSCLEPQPHAFPDECLLCGFPMRESQAEWFGRMFHGEREEPLGSRIVADAELDAMERRRFDRERAEGLRARGIFVPGN